MRGDRVVDLGDRVLGGVDPLGLDPAFAQPLDQEPHRAAGVEHRRGMEFAHDLLGDPVEEAEPVLVALVGDAAVVQVVVGPVLGRGAGVLPRSDRRGLISHPGESTRPPTVQSSSAIRGASR